MTTTMPPPKLMLLAALTALAVLASSPARAAQYIEIVREDAQFPGHCQERETLLYHPNGSEWTVQGICARRMCHFPYMYTHTCGAVVAEPPCWPVPGDPRLPYPACCPHALCPPPPDTDNELPTGEDDEEQPYEGQIVV